MSRGHMLGAAVAAVVLATLMSGCVQDQEPRSYVQANVVEKAYFQGEWWYTNKIIDVNVETDEWGFPGEPAYNFAQPEILSMERIRWVIDENYLYAMRSYELVEGGNPDGDDPGYIGEPVIAYVIESHFDIRRMYSPTTGESYNIFEENTKDRRWYERDFMRVDWSQIPMAPTVTNINLYEAYMGGILAREQVPMFVQDGSNNGEDYPMSYRPQFQRASLEFDAIHDQHLCDDPTTTDIREGDYEEGELYYMSFVTQEVISPSDVPDPYTGRPVNFCMSVYSNAPYCSSNAMFIRHSFLKISPDHDYATVDYQDRTRQNHFGTFQTAQWIYDTVDGDDPTDPIYGDTWFWHRNPVMMKLFGRYHRDDGTLMPKSERPNQSLTYFTSPETPRWLVRPAYELFIEWNDVFAKTFRAIRDEPLPTRAWDNPRNWFERPNTDGDYNDIDCWVGNVSGELAAEDPLPQRDEFLDPEADITPEISGMDAFASENNLLMHGSECWLKVQVNSCDAPIEIFPLNVQDRIRDYMDRMGKDDIDQVSDDELFTLGVQCEERGDIRFHLLSYVDLPAPNVGWLGIATLQGDPITGELIAGDANIGAAALHGYRRRAMEEYDLVTGNISELAFETGEDVRAYMDNLGYAMRPTRPARDMIEADLAGYYGVTQRGIREHMDHVMATKAQFLKGAEGYSQLLGPGRLAALKGTAIERNLLDNDDSLAIAGFENQGSSPGPRPVDAILETVSPFRNSFGDMMMRMNTSFKHNLQQNVIMPNSFIDYSVTKFAQDHAGMPRKNLVFEIEQKLYKDTLIHEMGHVVSQRHNFRGTNDPWNFPEPYFDIVARHPMPVPIEGCPDSPSAEDYDTNDDCALDAVEAQAYDTAWNEVRHDRELDGVDTWMTSSMMDYTGNWYERYMPEGWLVMPYDRAAIQFTYGDQVQVYDNSAGLLNRCHDPGSGRVSDCVTPLNTPQVLWTYYGGGDPCSVDADCPYNSAGEFAADLKADQVSAGFEQWCETHPGVGTQMCSNFYEDFERYYEGETDPTHTRWVVRRYEYCDDYNTPRNGGNDPRCDVFGEGTSYRENVENLRERYLRKYLFTYFRRYRATFGYGNVIGNWSFYIFEPLSLLHDMIYRYVTEGEEYRNDTGPYGFYDQYMACVDLMNFWMEIIGTPDIGSYRYDEYYDWYERWSPFPDERAADLRVKTGLGRHVYTSYQTGLNGIYRLEYIGTIYDKIYSLQAMLARGTAFNYSVDEMYFVNYYDFFPDEIRYLLMGLVTEEPIYYAPRVASIDDDTELPYLQYVDFYRGNCTVESPDGIEGYDTCRPEAHELYEGMTPLNDGKTFMLQNYGLIYGLAFMPTYFDTAPQEMLHFYKLGSLDDAEIPAGMVRGEDYEIHTSRSNHQSYMAFQMEDEPGKVGGSIAFEVIKKLKTMQDEHDAWTVCYEDENPDTNCGFENSEALFLRIRKHFSDISGLESLLTYALELQHAYGINSFMGYTPSM